MQRKNPRINASEQNCVVLIDFKFDIQAAIEKGEEKKGEEGAKSKLAKRLRQRK